jgi:hypothetical protein
MKNVVLKTCLTTLVLAMSGLAAANSVKFNSVQLTDVRNVTDNQDYTLSDQSLSGHSAVAGAALSIASGAIVNGDLAAEAAVTIGGGTHVQDLYAGAAVTLGGKATAQTIYAGAAAGIATGAEATTIAAGAAITVGADGKAQNIYSGAGITLGAGATQAETGQSNVFAGAARTGTLVTFDTDSKVDYEDESGEDATRQDKINTAKGVFNVSDAISDIGKVQDALSKLPTSPDDHNDQSTFKLGTGLDNPTFAPGVYEGSAVNAAANTVITLDTKDTDNQVWVFNLTDALTLGAGTTFNIEGGGSNPIVIWNIGGTLNLGAHTQFFGTAYISGSVSGATSTVSCGNLYAKGALAIGSMGQGFVDEFGVVTICSTQSASVVNVTVEGTVLESTAKYEL